MLEKEEKSMNKKLVFTATISLALVALAGCGKETEPVKKTMREEFEEIVDLSGGLSRNEFFSQAAGVTRITNTAKERTLTYSDIPGESARLFGMEYSWGYYSQDYAQTCTLYSNDVRMCSLKEDTTKTIDDFGNTKTTTLKQTSQAYVDDQRNFVAITDDDDTENGEGMYAIPNNFKQIIPLEGQKEFISYASLALSMNSGITKVFSLSYYETERDESTEKYYSEYVDGTTILNYLNYEDLGASNSNATGHEIYIKASIHFGKDGNVSKFALEYKYFYFESNVFTTVQEITFGYGEKEEYTGNKFDPTHYYDYGYVLPDVGEPGDKVEEFDELFGLVNGASQGTNDIAYGAPIQVNQELSQYITGDIFEDGADFMTEQTTTTIKYSDPNHEDGVLSSISTIKSTEYAGMTLSSTSQVTKEGNSIVKIVHDVDNTQYKVTTPIDAEHSVEDAMDLSEKAILAQLAGMLEANKSSDEANAAAREEEEPAIPQADLFEVNATTTKVDNVNAIVLQADFVTQQTNDTPAERFYFEIAFELEKEGETVVGVNVIYSLMIYEITFDWQLIAQAYTANDYTYGTMKSTEEVGYEVKDPKLYEEKVATKE